MSKRTRFLTALTLALTFTFFLFAASLVADSAMAGHANAAGEQANGSNDSGPWRGEYYNNISLVGPAALVRQDASINFNWGTGSPAPNVVGANNFSVRWTQSPSLESGRYRFESTTDDGVRVWVNNQLLIDRWFDQQATTYTAEIDLPAGTAQIRMEYYENAGAAVAKLEFYRVGDAQSPSPTPVTPPQPAPPIAYPWRGEYFNNMTLAGGPSLVRDDASINFNWGTGSPAPGVINSDHFSVRWTQNAQVVAGRYRFSATTDDGVRVWVNGHLVIDAWYDHAAQTFSGEIDLPAGAASIQMEYFENLGLAQAQLSWAQTAPGSGAGSGNGVAVIVTGNLNVRSGPGIIYSVIAVLPQGTTVPLAGYRNSSASWVMIVLPDGSLGWVNAGPSYIKTNVRVSSLPVWTGSAATPLPPQPTATPVATPATPVATPATAVATVTASYLNVRSGSGVSHGVIAVTTKGTVVTMNGRNSAATWVRVVLPNGITGWVNASYLQSAYAYQNLPVVSG